MNNHGLMHLWGDLERFEDSLSRGGRGGWMNGPREFDSFGRPFGSLHGSIGVPHETSRVQRVRNALRRSGDLAKDMIVRSLAGIDLSTIWDILIEAVKDMALCYGASVVGGGVIGGVAGAFAGGVGAAPGATAGAAAGATVGGWILAWMGLKALAEGLIENIPAALEFYKRGFIEAWGPTHRDQPGYGIYAQSYNDNTEGAAWQIANGHVLLIMAMLGVMVAYLTRGRGDKALMMKEVRQSSRLGPKVANWLEKNEETLRNHPKLKRREPRGATAPPEEPRLPVREEKPRREPEKPKGMKKKKVPCFKPNDLPQGAIPEFDRQLLGQENGLNDMTVDEYLKGRETYSSARDPKVAKAARALHQEGLENEAFKQLRQDGLSRNEAKAKATEIAADKMKTLAALHNPDLVAGGKDAIGDFGDKNINSRIGAQWKSRVGELDKAAKEVPVTARGSVKMNAKLERCK